MLQKPGSEIVLGYRCWRFVPDLSKCSDPEVRKIRVPYDVPPLLVYFHGNGEVAPEYDSFAQVYLRLGVRLCVVDFRGYGWSSDAPTKASELLSDMMAVIYGLDDLKTAAGLPRDCKTILFGRSMGSIPAAHLACLAPSCFDGIIVESGVAVSVGAAKGKVLETSEKFGLVPDDVPALVIHGDADARAAQESEIPNFKGSYLGRFPLVSADLWTSDHLSGRYRSVDAFVGTRARGTLTLKRR